MINERETCIGAIKRFRLEIANTEIMQHLPVAKYFGRHRCGIGIRVYRYGLIFKIWRNFRFD